MGIVTLENVSKIYSSRQGNVYAVRDVNLDIQSGEFYSLLGSSASGKTTILRLIGGWEFPEQGRILVSNEDVTRQPYYKRNVHTVFQKYALFPHLTVAENITNPLALAGIPKTELAQRTVEAIATFRLEGLVDRKPSQLSGGQQQRVALAKAMIGRPKVLLLDEPLFALDVNIREEFRIGLRELQKHTQITCIYVTHNQEEAMILSDRLAVMHNGRVEQVGTPREIYDRPTSVFVAKFIGKSNLLTGKVINNRTVDINGYVLDIQTGNQPLVKGEEVTVMIRPERLQINPRTLRDQEITGKIVNCTYSGQTKDYQVSTSMGVLNVTKLSTGTDYALNTTVEISWSTADCIVLPN